MNTIIIKDVDQEIKRRFKVHCAELGISMKEGFLRLMDLEVEQRILFSPWTLNVKLEKKDKKGV